MGTEEGFMTDEEIQDILNRPHAERLPQPDIGPIDSRGELERILGRQPGEVGQEFQDSAGVKRVIATPPEAVEQKVVEVGKRIGRPPKWNTVSVREKLIREKNPILFEREFVQERHYRKPVNANLPEGTEPVVCDNPECHSPNLFFVDPTSTRHRDVQAQYMAVGQIHVRLVICRDCHKLHIMIYE